MNQHPSDSLGYLLDPLKPTHPSKPTEATVPPQAAAGEALPSVPDHLPPPLRGLGGALALGVLIAAGLAGHHFTFSIFFGADFIFGSIFALLALQIFGIGRGVVAALIISSILCLGWGHHYGLIIMTAEVAVVGWLNRRRRIGFIQADVLYWLFIGMPLVYVSYHFGMKVPQSHALFLMAKAIVNGLVNILAARLLFAAFAVRLRRSPLSYREAVYTLLAMFVLGPTLIMMALGSRTHFKETDRHTRATLAQSSLRLTDRIETWVANRKSALLYLAEMAASKSPQQMQSYLEQTQKSDINFLRLGLLNSEATVTAYYPLRDELGQANIGKNFADRPFIPTLQQTLKPMLSEVVLGRVGTPKPIVAMLAPVVTQGTYGGYVAGVLSLDQIRGHLDKSMDEEATFYTLLDKNNNVIMTNRTDQKVMAPFDRGEGTLRRPEAGIHQWVPTLPPHALVTERWGNSLYVGESRIGNLAEWTLILEQPLAPFQKALFDRYSRNLAMLLLLLLVSLLVAEIVSRSMTRSLEELGSLTHDLPMRLASEGPAVHWPDSDILESKHLISNFRLMAGSLSEQFNKVRQTNESLERRVEERTRELQASEERYRRVSAMTSDIAYSCVTNKDGRFSIKWMTGAAHAITGYTIEEIKAHGCWCFLVIAEDQDLFEKQVNGLRPGTKGSCELRFRHKDGSLVWVASSAECVAEAQAPGGPMLYGGLEDITDRKRAEQALIESEHRYRRITEGLTDYQYSVRVEQGRAMETTHGLGCEAVTGYTVKDFAANPYLWFTMIPPEDREAARLRVAQILEGQELDPFKHRIIRKDGALRWVSDTSILNKDMAGRLLSYDGVVEDITERMVAEEALRESEARFRGLLQSVDSVAVQSYGPDGTTHYWNQASERLYGYSAEEAIGRSLLDLIVPKDMREGVAQDMRSMWETGVPIPSSELSLLRKDGSPVMVYTSHAIVRVPGHAPEMFCMDVDLTDRKRLEAQLHQSQKMESLGILAGGVAHDMNNVLGAILGLASVHLDMLPPGSPLHRAFTTITKACTRGGNLIQSLLGFARQSLAEDKELDLNALVRDEVRLLERTTLARVRLEIDLAADLRPIRGDASALTHVLMNLCVNAVDAMPDNGTLTLRTRNVSTDWIEVQVEDTGSGMPKAVLEKALDPFFTTKEQGKGTGLGLSIAHSTVMAHHGQMEILSEPGRGTLVLLRFPTCEARDFAADAAPSPRREAPHLSLKVLLVDDDELIQSSMQAILEILNHTVATARTGEEALAALEAGYEPDVVILDLNMPGLGGAGTLPRLRALRPSVPVLLATGRADQTAMNLIEVHPFVTLLSKPFGMKELQQHLEPLRRG